ncbi:unnamed protein product [Lymnaea stagnalis]|uniref:Uncharacterized protein n=1 Tax=Lymnaea stagnalis TaxID=6523 RepID=A0AAV2HE89_LYMST
MKYGYAVVLVLFVARLGGVLPDLFDDSCRLSNLYSKIPPTEEPGVYMTIPTNCTEGQYDWDWPQGSVHLMATLPVAHSLCIEARYEGIPMLGGIRDLTGGANRSLELPTKDHPACTESARGKTELLVQAWHSQLYWTTFYYKVVLA